VAGAAVSEPVPFITNISNNFVPVVAIVFAELQKRWPHLNADQIRELIVVEGALRVHQNLNLPRPGSNPDEDA
jgi:hypothetical protein